MHERQVVKGGLGLFLFFFIGWIINIISVIMQFSGETINSIGDASIFLIFQSIGIFIAPVGSILGWISLFV
jgi:hypothetical protein